jgi:AcrR family transcriptional regulator
MNDGYGMRARLLRAAITLCAERGFDGSTMRDLAAAVGIKAPGIYNHFSSKEEILAEAVNYALSNFFGSVLQDLERDPPDQRLRTLVRRHVLYQLEQREMARANDALLNTGVLNRNLPRRKVARLVEAQRLYLEVVKELVRAKASADAQVDTSIAALSITAMCDRVSAWYNPEGRLTPEEVADEIWRLIEEMLS